jgi:peptidoglycan/LPS O-acetylase OafA/YrhL
MRRLPTNFTLAGWAGFLLVAALHLAAAPMLPISAGAGNPSGIDPAALLHPVDGRFVLLLVAAAPMLAALLLLNEGRTDRRALGERLAVAGLGLAAVLVMAAGPALVDVDPRGLAFWAVFGASLLAIVFDHLVTDESPDDEADFRAGIALIAQGMARQTLLYAEHDGPDGKGPGR